MNRQLLLIFALILILSTQLFSEHYTLCNKDLKGNCFYYQTFKAPNSKNLFVGTYGGILKSTDNGSTWENVDGEMGEFFIKETIVKNNKVYAVAYPFGFFVSACSLYFF